MALATFNKIAGTKNAVCVISVQKNPLDSKRYCFAPLAGVEHFAGKPASELEKGFAFSIPDGYELREIQGIASLNGEPLYELGY